MLVSSPRDSCWFVYYGKDKSAKTFKAREDHKLKQTPTGSLWFYRKPKWVCAEPNPSTCVERKLYCDKKQQFFSFGK